MEDCAHPQVIVKAKFYRAFCGVGQPIVLVDSLPASNGVRSCFPADTSVCVTYFMTQVDIEGQESCMNGAAISFPQRVGVDPQPATFTGPWQLIIDVQSRRMELPLRSGRYFLLTRNPRTGLLAVRETLVIR